MPALPDSASPSEVVSRVCVLMFHRVVDRLDEPHDIAPSQFDELLASLSSCKGLDDPGDPFSPSSGRGCLLTFDDATADHLAVAEILGRAGVRGVFYVPTGKVGGDGHLTAAQIVDVAAMGHTIGSHCVSHRTADRMSRPALAAELAESKAYLEDLLGHEVGALALPGGVVTKPAPALARDAGYTSLRLTRWGIYRSEEERWSIPAVPVTRYTVRRGWVEKAARDLELPADMALAARAKALLPRSIAERVRGVLHRAGGEERPE
jgi:peptidoglycan/xylan/chitin deacetylase (PgdA/CDA1 family)